MSNENSPKFAFGDLVRVNGYYPRVFQIDGYRREQYFYPDEQWTELVYELHAQDNGEWLEAEEADLTPVPEGEAQQSPTQSLKVTLDWSHLFEREADSMAKDERKPTARELSSREAEERKLLRKLHAEVVDDLLDELRDYKALYAEFGDVEYGDRVFAIEAELKKLTDVEK